MLFTHSLVHPSILNARVLTKSVQIIKKKRIIAQLQIMPTTSSSDKINGYQEEATAKSWKQHNIQKTVVNNLAEAVKKNVRGIAKKVEKRAVSWKNYAKKKSEEINWSPWWATAYCLYPKTNFLMNYKPFHNVLIFFTFSQYNIECFLSR